MNKNIIIIEDEAIIAESIKQKVINYGYNVLCITDNCDDAIQAFINFMPDIVISDIYIKGTKSGIDFAKQIAQIKPVPVIFITAYSKDVLMDEICELNNISFLTKPFTNEQLLACLDLANKRATISKTISGLTSKELIIVKHLMNGKSSKEIATIENISFHTVEAHRKNILQKLNVKRTTEIISVAVKSGLQ